MKTRLIRAIGHRHGVIQITRRGSRSLHFGRKALDVDFTNATPLEKIQMHAHGFARTGGTVLPADFKLADAPQTPGNRPATVLNNSARS